MSKFDSPATDTDGGVDILNNRSAFLASQQDAALMFMPDPVINTGEDRRAAALDSLVSLVANGYDTTDVIGDAEVLARWLATGERGVMSREAGGRGPTAGAGPALV